LFLQLLIALAVLCLFRLDLPIRILLKRSKQAMNLPRTSCPFITGPKIEDPALFVGREEELRLLAARMSGSQPVSVNVAGGRLSGKSSLLWYFTKEWARYVPDPARFVVVSINLQQVKPATETEFYQALVQALRKLPAVEQITPLRSTLAHFSGGSREFGDVLDVLAGQGILPVFCLDEFEKLFDHVEALSKDFYDRLRGLMSTNKMMLIIASRKPLEVCGAEQQLNSAFFNMAQLCELKDFSDEEAEELLLLPSPLAPALDAEERRLAKKWGGRQPHLLQLAALCLFDARQAGKDAAWAKKRFEAQRSQVKPDSIWTRPLGLVLRSCRTLLDPLAEDSEKCRKVLINIVLPLAGLIVLACALLTGKVQLSAALDWLLKKTGLL
jgi:hypothetical protein